MLNDSSCHVTCGQKILLENCSQRGPKGSSAGGCCSALLPSQPSKVPSKLSPLGLTGATCTGAIQKLAPAQLELLDFSSNRFEILRAKFSRPGPRWTRLLFVADSLPSSPVPTGGSELGAGPALRQPTKNFRKKGP